ncbi:PQQ-like beta-propeller repeat protein [Halobacterium sp. KA-4]|uniref:outer membrane protein assembly factor BamB family protein n=1 Tax=Halobacterium sp. KA-4 TaxID=2896367 RepID=UPI001E3F1F59|nr:PQQ-binding-like beta-propeller repeat protein [Halobacterium sp. KA-4]MCD2199039.1 PQQ-like beta-propeller repeat protein [Halobacterium sp. KA-4]
MPSRRDVLKTGALGAAGLLAGGAARYGAWSPAPLDPPEGTWLQPRYDDGNTGHNPDASPPTGDPSLAWTYDVAGAVNALASGVGHLYVGTDHAVYAFADGDQHPRWDRAASGYRIAVGPDVVVAVGRGMVAAFAASNGALRWRHDVESRVYGVLVDQRTAYVGVDDRLDAYALDSGRRRWRVETGADTFPALDGRHLLAGASNLAAYEPRGALRGVLVDAPTRAWTSRDVFGPTRPVVTGNRIVAGETTCFQTETCGVNVVLPDGTREHYVELGNSAGSIASDGDRAYVVSIQYGDSENGYNVPDSSTLHGIDVDTAEERWSFQRPGWFCPPVVANDTVYVGEAGNEHGDGNVYALDAETGETRWTYGEPNGVTVLAAVRDALLVGTDDGGVLELQ